MGHSGGGKCKQLYLNKNKIIIIKKHMALYMLPALLRGVCVQVGTECCVYVPHVHHNTSQALWVLASETHTNERLTGEWRSGMASINYH